MGLEILLATAINGVLVLIASIVFDAFFQTILMLVPFMLIRSKAGGFHAKTHTGCILGFLSVYVAGVLLLKALPIEAMQFVSFCGLVLSGAIILPIGAIQHKNRQVTPEEYQGYQKTARRLAILLPLVGLVGTILVPQWFLYYTFGLFVAAGSLLAAWIIDKKLKGN